MRSPRSRSAQLSFARERLTRSMLARAAGSLLLSLVVCACAAEGGDAPDARSNDPLAVRDGPGRGKPSRACVRALRTIARVTPREQAARAPGEPVTFEVEVTNNDSVGCASSAFVLDPGAIEEGIEWLASTEAEIAPGESARLALSVRGGDQLEPGTYPVHFRVVRLGDGSELPGAAGQVRFVIPAPPGCAVRVRSELMIRDLSVVEDPRRTTFDGNVGDPSRGALTFARLIEEAAPTPAAAPLLVEELFRTWLRDQTINGFIVPARTEVERFLLAPWRRTPDGRLDLTRVPLRLLAVVNRIDLRDVAAGHAGEAAFVFGMFNPADFELGAPTRRARPVEFTLVMEYRLPARSTADVVAWASAFHQLGSLAFPSDAYNAALEALVRRITSRGVAPDGINGSALLRVRTNDGKLVGGDWELREFGLSPETGLLAPRPLRLTPDPSMQGTPRLARFVNENEARILIEQHEIPDLFEGAPFLAGAVSNDEPAWDAEGITHPEARYRFSLNTCNGCHGAETDTLRKHVGSRLAGELAPLSSFLTGSTVPDPVTGELREYGDLARRRADLEAIVCGAEPAGAAGARAPLAGIRGTLQLQRREVDREALLSRGIARTH